MNLRGWLDDAFAEALGREHRHDPVLPGTGGPAGNALLTAWTGLLLLVLFGVEMATLLNLRSLLSWHVVVGILLVPPALLKTATTGWRIVGYYTKRAPYRSAGPPPMPLRMLGPLVVLFTLAVLGSGLTLIALGPTAGRAGLLTVMGVKISTLTIHQGFALVWAAVTGLHTLGRLLPALRIVSTPLRTGTRVPGMPFRVAALIFALFVAAVAATLVLGMANPQLPHWLHRG